MKINERHLSTAEAQAEVNARHGEREVSDACAVTIASWWVSPTGAGAHLAALSTGAEVDRDALVLAISDTIGTYYGGQDAEGKRCLDMLATWAISQSRA